MKQNTITKKSNIEKQWYIIDANNLVLGRLSTVAASLLIGKSKVYYAPNLDCGDFVILINCKNIRLTKNKINTKKYYNHSQYMGGLRVRTAKVMKEKYLDEMIRRSIKGMLPHNKLSDKRIKRLHIYEGSEHKHIAQNPVKYRMDL